jgi:hypothetical protein
MLGALAPSGGSDTARMQVITHSAAAAAGPGVPITWATGDEVRVTITYSV